MDISIADSLSTSLAPSCQHHCTKPELTVKEFTPEEKQGTREYLISVDVHWRTAWSIGIEASCIAANNGLCYSPILPILVVCVLHDSQDCVPAYGKYSSMRFPKSGSNSNGPGILSCSKKALVLLRLFQALRLCKTRIRIIKYVYKQLERAVLWAKRRTKILWGLLARPSP